MPFVGYRVEIDSRRILERLNLVRTVIEKPPRTVYDALRQTMKHRVDERFAKKRDPDGIRWKNWAPSTAADREEEGGVAYKSGRISLLQYTGAMQGSFFAKTRGGIVSVGFGVPYAKYHETGTRKKGSNQEHMPARRVLTDGQGRLSKQDRISAGLAVRQAVIKSLDRYLNT